MKMNTMDVEDSINKILGGEMDVIYGVISSNRTQEGQTALQLAISNQLPLVVDAICTRGADMSVMDDKGDPPLWLALENGLEDIASTLVRKNKHTHVFKLILQHQRFFFCIQALV